MNAPKKRDPIRVVRENEAGQHEDAVTATWTGYLNGHWTRTVPERTGCYPVADKSGEFAGTVVIYRNPRSNKLSSTRPWKGWWWSFPLPPAPISPSKIWEEGTPSLRLVKND